MQAFLAQLFVKYSLVALGLGAFFEGETILLTAGVLVSRGKLNGIAVWIVASVGAWLGHMVWFGIGRWMGSHRIIARFPRWERGIRKADEVVLRRPILSIVLLQYMYGMRMIGALALGFSNLSVTWFAVVEALNCLVWAFLVRSEERR